MILTMYTKVYIHLYLGRLDPEDNTSLNIYVIYLPPYLISFRSGTMAGNYCCYRRGNLCTDSECGGTVDKVTPRDWPTYLQHTMEDVIPAVFCCKDPFSNCGNYQQKRPIDDGSKSPPPPPPPGIHINATLE